MSVWVLKAPEGFGDAGFHAHHAIQITACLEGNLRLIDASGSLDGPVLAVKSGAKHRLEASGILAFVFIEPESRTGRALTRSLFGAADLIAVDSRIRDELASLATIFSAPPDRAAMLEAGARVIAALEPAIEANEPDRRVRQIMDRAAAKLDGPVSLRQAAEGIYLSESRLRHLFVEQTGIAFKTYLLWLRLICALDHYAQGSSLTEAAHAAGFSDSAHFSRIFRRTFGLPATTLTRV
jgi:AraC-like DNA-binding protein